MRFPRRQGWQFSTLKQSALATPGGGAIPVVPASVSLTRGVWGGVDLVEETTLTGDLTFAEVDASPTGISVNAASGLVSGVPTATGETVSRYSCTTAGGARQDVEVTWTVAAGATNYDRVTDLNKLTLGSQGDGDPSNTLTTNTGQITIAGRLYMPSDVNAGGSAGRNLFQNVGRSTFLFFSSGLMAIKLRGVGNVALASYTVSNFDNLFSSGMTDFVITVDTSQAVEADRLRLWIDGVAQSVSVGGDGALALNDVLDVTRNGNEVLDAFPPDWQAEWFYVSFGEALTPTDFATGPEDAGSPEILIAGDTADWNAGTNLGSGGDFTAAGTFTLAARSLATPLTYPGAVGHGRYATGGRGGTVRNVSGATPAARGSALVTAAAAGGYVRLVDEGEYFVSETILVQSDTTIDGRFAPGMGAWVTGSGYRVEGESNVVLDNLLVAPGSNRRSTNYSVRRGISLSADGATTENIYVRRCGSLWDTDENFSMWGAGAQTGQNVTWDECVCAESLAFPREDAGNYKTRGHPLQWIIGGASDWLNVSVIGCASISGEERNILINPGTGRTVSIEIIGSAFINPGNQGMVFTGSGSTAARMEASMFIAGPMTSANRELIFWDGPGGTPTNPLYLDDKTAVWTYSGTTLTKNVFVQSVTTEDNQLNLVRDAATANDGTIYDASDWGDPDAAGVPARSNATLPANLETVYDTIRTDVGPKRRGGDRHPLIERIIRYSMPERTAASTLAVQPFTTDLTYFIGTKNGLIDELALIGVEVSVGTGKLDITIPTGALPGVEWDRYYIQVTEAVIAAIGGWTAATDYDITTNASYRPDPDEQRSTVNATPGDDTTSPSWSEPDDDDLATPGTTKPVTGLDNTTTYAIRVGFVKGGNTVWLESGIVWRVD